MEEIWKDIPNYEGLYQVSNLGNVKSLNHIRKNGTNEYMQRGRKLKPQKANNYLFVKLSKEKRMREERTVCVCLCNDLSIGGGNGGNGGSSSSRPSVRLHTHSIQTAK